jgi:hypothetical protein
MTENASMLQAHARSTRRVSLTLLLPASGALLGAACLPNQLTSGRAGGDSSENLGHGGYGPMPVLVAWPALNRWPEPFRRARPDVQEAYRYAVANPQILQYFPCYCGCEDEGHTSNKDCYIDEFRPDGSVVLDPMSFG